MSVWINEFHYDNASTDQNEAIEIAGTAGTNLAGYSIALYNGGTTAAAANAATVYSTISLSGTLSNAGSGFGFATFNAVGLQNGSNGATGPGDGFALVDPNGQVVQFLSYEGVLKAASGPAATLTSTDIGVYEDGNGLATDSLRLVGTGTSYADFHWVSDAPSSFGAVNQGQTFGTGGGTTGASFAIASGTGTEGDSGTTPITFTVTRSGDTTGAGTVDYAVAFDGTASASDLSGATTGTVSFAAGATSQTITLQIAGDTTYEGDETFHVKLSNASTGSTIGTPSALGTIHDNDPAPPPAPLFINEIHYDNLGDDTGEGIEIAGPAGTNLSGWSIVLYNGTNGQSYGTTALTGTIANQDHGYGTAYVTYPQDGLQNGSPDGIALVAPNGQVVQFLSYEGVMTATNGPAAGLTSTDIGVSETSGPVGQSLQLTGTGAVAGDFTWQQDATASFGQVNAGETFYPADGPGYYRVGDTSVVEGNSGTAAMTFTITRSGGSAAASTVDYSVNLSGTADASDLAPGQTLSGSLSFAVGDVSKTVTVLIAGDTSPEPNETLSLSLNNPSANTYINDGVGIGTITNDDAVSLHTYEIQGAGLKSDYVGQQVSTTGIVTAVGSSGFYVQDATGDGNANTSDAIFVATTSKASILVGDQVTVSGTIAEAGGSGALTVTEFAAGATVTVGPHDQTLPTAVVIGHDGLHPPTEIIDNDHLTSSDPATDGIDFYETLEGMRVTIEAPQVVARTDSGESWVVASHGQDATGMNAAGGITVSPGDYNPEKILIDPTSDVSGAFSGTFSQGDQLADVTGILTYGTSSSSDVGYKLIPTTAATLTYDANLQPEVTALKGDATHLTVASFNMENADVSDGAAKFALIADAVVTNLKAPDIIFAQEIQDADGAGAGTDYSGQTTANAVIAAIDAKGGPHYTYVEVAPTANNTTGGETNGNIRPGFFYNADRVTYDAGTAHQITDAAFDGSRKPLVADFTFNGQTVTAIDVHSTSRLGSDSLFGSYQPPLDGGDSDRTAQGQAIGNYVANILSNDPNHNVVVGGDFNGFYFEGGLTAIENSGMTNLNSLIPAEERYSYLFDGNLEQIDNILTSQSLLDGAAFDAVHINTLKATSEPQATDHDQVIASLYIPTAETPPSAVADAVNVDEDATSANLYATLLANDSDPDAGQTLTITGVDTTGTLGHVVFDANTHSLQYVADYDGFDQLPTGATATDQFSYVVSDGTDSATTTVMVTVTGQADGISYTGGATNDSISGTTGEDKLYGLGGNDTIGGGDGADFLSGGIGNDQLNGGNGRDTLLGGTGADNLNGGAGDDYLSGDAGNDTLTGGLGADIFVFDRAGGKDVITDFNTSVDHILLANNLAIANYVVGDVNGDGTADLTVNFTYNTSVVLLGVSDINAVTFDHSSSPAMSAPAF